MKRGQAALEFLMTYGWALMAVLGTIGVLGYFGLLSPTTLLPEKCEIAVGFTCSDFSLSPTQAKLVLTNMLGDDVTVNKIELINPETVTAICSVSPSFQLKNGAKNTFTLPCTDPSALPPGTKKNLKIKIDYAKVVDEKEFLHTIIGVLFASSTEQPTSPAGNLNPSAPNAPS